MATNIRDLNLVSVVSGADQIPINDVTSNRTRAMTVQQLADYILSNSGGKKVLNFVPISGSSIVLDSGTNDVFLDPAGTIAAFTITFPSGSANGQVLTIYSTAAITSLTLNAAAGQTLRATTSAMAANSSVKYCFSVQNKAWYRA